MMTTAKRKGAAVSVLLVAFCLLGLALGQASGAETVAQLDAAKSSYIETKSSDLSSGVFSATLWVYPERASAGQEAVLSFASSDLKASATVGWREGRFYYSDAHVGEQATAATYDRNAWHYVALTTSTSDQAVYHDAGGSAVWALPGGG